MDAATLRAIRSRATGITALFLLVSALWAAPSTAADSRYELVMVHQDGCYECQAWDNLLGPIYPKTSEGRFAPLRRVDLRGARPDDLEFKYRPFVTPTFILVENGKELGRIEGNPGDEFFWIYLDRLLSDHTDFKADPS